MIAKVQQLPLTETKAPPDQAAAADAMADAFAAATPVYPIGGGTALSIGPPAAAPGIGLWTAGLNRVIDYPWRDLTVTVEAGITIAALAERLAEQGQRLPVEIPNASRATIGGAVAANPSGPRRFRNGTLRDYVLGLRAVDGQGKAFAAGGRVVKNAAGYNVCRLLVGSMGTLAVITQVTLMVKPIPETSACVVADLPDLDVAERALGELVRSECRPAAVELLAGPAWRDEPALAPASDRAAGRLLVGFEGFEAEVEWMVEKLQAEWRRLGMPPQDVIGAADADRIWDRLTEFSSPGEAPGLTVRYHVLPSAAVRVVRGVLAPDPDASLQAHAGDGVIVARCSPPEPERVPEFVAGKLRPIATAAGGRMIVLSYPEGAKVTGEAVWGPPPQGFHVMQQLKGRFDPKGLLNPGRFIFER